MNLIEQQCQKIKAENRLGFMTHVVVGYPDVATTRSLVRLMVEEGVDFIELQIPFSDPLGDGPVIRAANAEALAGNVRMADSFRLAKQLIKEDKIKIPIFLMTYFNIPFVFGLEKFCAAAEQAGVSGLIIPDYNLDMEPRERFEEHCRRHHLVLQRFASFDNTTERLKQQAKEASGFIYCFATRGVTGARAALDPCLLEKLKRLRSIFTQPLAVGFGVSSGDQVRSLKGHADIVIVGSALIKAYQDGGLEMVRQKIKGLVGALKSYPQPSI